MDGKIEILAPAGGMPQLTAAVRSGADAVYLGAPDFSARRNAANFGDEELAEAVGYCHERGVKVYTAVNILISDDEIPSVVSLAKKLCKIGVDGVIVQDFAVARIFSVCCPEIPLHASTQMTVHNKAGVKFLEKYGFDRFVAAREMTYGELKSLISSAESEAEIFVHGALCMCVSGCCYLSSMLGGRSGNRGLCAQSCRLDFRAGQRPYALSLKDMSYIDSVDSLISAGAASFKIEGRMKRPEYVAAAVTAFRNAVDGKKYDKDMLRNVFSRSGFTDGYFFGKRDLSMFGFRTKEDVMSASGDVFAAVHELYRSERQSVGIKMSLFVSAEKSSLTASDGDNTVTVFENGGQIAEFLPLTRENALKNIAKTGGTPYYVEDFELDNGDGLYLPASVLNSLRREALLKLGEKRREVKYAPPCDYSDILSSKTHRFSGFYVRFARIEQVFDCGERIILPFDEILKNPSAALLYRDKLVAEAPSLVFESEEGRFIEKVRKLKEMGVSRGLADNIGQAQILLENGFEVIAGFGMNIMNSTALSEYKKAGISEAVISFETSAEKIKRLKTDMDIAAVVYGYLPLMKFRNCPLKKADGCASCRGAGELVDRKNKKFAVSCFSGSYSSLFNSVPLDVADRDFSFVEHKLLYFTFESKEECIAVYESAVRGERFSREYTSGLYYRKLL